jgi:cytochrome c1
MLPNTPQNLVAWIRDPPGIDPLTAMPASGMSEAEARDVAAYLYTLD